jgi:hypothetical protein
LHSKIAFKNCIQKSHSKIAFKNCIQKSHSKIAFKNRIQAIFSKHPYFGGFERAPNFGPRPGAVVCESDNGYQSP